MDGADSILSHGERQVALARREGQSIGAIAEERGVTEAQVEKTLDRVGEKTERALATLLQSPTTAEAVARLEEAERARLRDLLVTESG
jgi:DNA-binding NarL/FixJ family response regulator